MTQTVIDENETRVELLGSKMRVHAVIETIETTDSGYDASRDEHHESTRVLNTEEKTLDCPIEQVHCEQASNDITISEFETLFTDSGASTANRVDYETVKYIINGDTYLVEYDMTPVDAIR